MRIRRPLKRTRKRHETEDDERELPLGPPDEQATPIGVARRAP